jgi:DNA helicase HerA-like ATPase
VSSEQQLGRLVSISGAQVIALLDNSPASDDGGVAVSVGSLVKMETAHSHVYGMVTGQSIPIPSQDGGAEELRISELELVGEVSLPPAESAGVFTRGITLSPGLGDPVFSADSTDIATVYAQPNEATIAIGNIHLEKNLPAHVGVDNLLGKHFAILGTTGCGKSCTVSLLLHEMIKQHPNAHVLLLDSHGEYEAAFGDVAEQITPSDLEIPYWLFSFDEFCAVVFGRETDDLVTEVALLRDLIQKSKLRFLGEQGEEYPITVDTPVPYKMGDLNRLLDETMGKLENRNELAPYLRIRNRLNTLANDRRYSFIFPSSLVVRDNMATLLSRMFRIPVNEKPISILNLTGVPSEILNVVISVICRLTFDFGQWSEPQMPILLVCEEAHRYAPNNSVSEFEPAKEALSRLAKEGRKYGISLGVVSQRPSELAVGVLSQCSTVFAMRMTSQKDQDFIQAAISDSAVGLIESLPSLGNAEAIAVGEGVPVPMRLSFKSLPENQRPKSATAQFAKSWSGEAGTIEGLQDTIERWRSQRR